MSQPAASLVCSAPARGLLGKSRHEPGCFQRRTEVTTIDELKAAVERYRKGDYYTKDAIIHITMEHEDRHLISDCLTDDRKIDGAVLKGMGFRYYDGAYRYVYRTYEDREIEPDEVTVAFRYAIPVVRVNLVVCEPQPRTVGHLYSLLLRLMEDEG